MTDSPDVSIIIPTRNRWELLKEALETALGQRDVAIEAIVVDDASEDGTAARLDALGDDRVRCVRHDRRQGVSRGRNEGLALARGAWVAFLDDDDLWSPWKLRLQLDAAERASASFAYGASALINISGDVTAVVPAPDPTTVGRQLLAENVVPGGCSNAIARTELVRAVGGFDEEISQMADWDLWIRLTQESPAAACQEAVVGYLRHAQNMFMRDRTDVLREFSYLKRKHRHLAHGSRAAFDHAAMLRWYGGELSRAGRRRAAAGLYAEGALAYRDPILLVRALAYARPQTGLKRLVRSRRRKRREALARDQARTTAGLTRIERWLEFASRTETGTLGSQSARRASLGLGQ